MGRGIFSILLTLSFVLAFSSFSMASASIDIFWNQGDIQIFQHGDSIFVNDPNRANTTPPSPDETIDNLQITSTLDEVGINPILYEIDDSGLFKSGLIKFGGSSKPNFRIAAWPGHQVTATLPSGESNMITVQANNPNSLDELIGVHAALNLNAAICEDEGWTDDDNDGICDEWENYPDKLVIPYPRHPLGYALEITCGSPTSDLEECPRPGQEDLLIEIDWIRGHKPLFANWDENLEELKQAFWNHGIKLHVQLDEETVDHIDLISKDGTANYPGFDQIKRKYGGTDSERALSWWEAKAWQQKKQVFHYGLFVHSYQENSGASGTAEMFGNDLLVSMGSFYWGIGSSDKQIATLMHELGHNMGLSHGGHWSEDTQPETKNCKPNYISVMSYSRQFSDLVNRDLEFSKRAIGTQEVGSTSLNENSLEGSKGIGNYPTDANPTFEEIVFGDGAGNPVFGFTTSAETIDWPGTTADINWIVDPTTGKDICPSSGTTTLTGFWDMDPSYYELNIRDHGNWQDGRGSTHSPVADIIIKEKSFEPNFLEVSLSNETNQAQVKWNVDSINSHKISGGTPTSPMFPFMNSVEISDNETHEVIFTKEGVYPFFDMNNFDMKGVIVVGDVCFNSHDFKKFSMIPTNSSVCSAEELEISDVLGFRIIRLNYLEDLIQNIPDKEFLHVDPLKYKSDQKTNFGKMRTLVLANDEIEELALKLLELKKDFDGTGGDDVIKTGITKDKIHNFIVDTLKTYEKIVDHPILKIEKQKGATVELDQKVYTWTDKVYITIVAPDHNFDSDLVDEIGNTVLDPIKVETRGFTLDNYKLVETGTNTGIFTGEVTLTGFDHDADGDGTNDTNPRTSGSGPTDGFLEADDDGITVSFEFSEDETVVGSALIRWNIGQVQWDDVAYVPGEVGIVRIIDPDMNLDPEAVDNFDVDVWSDSDAVGIDLTVTETNEATGIFEGTVFFTVTDKSSGHRLEVSEGDTITAEYEDNTLPNPYTTADELDITETAIIGTYVTPLERAPASNARIIDAFGNPLTKISVDQQVQITADIKSGQDREQSFAYLVQVQDANGVTVSLAWITGSLSPGQSFSPSLSWIPQTPGTYTATMFVWEKVDNPTAISPPVSVKISVN